MTTCFRPQPPLRRRATRALLAPCLTLALLLGGTTACRTPQSAAGQASLTAAPVWPPAPNPARIRWEGEIRSAADFGIRPGFFERLWNWASGRQAPRLVRPHGLAVDPEGRLWVADPGARLVHVFDPARGRYLSLPKKGDPKFLSPIAVAHDSDGVAYVSDSAHGLVRRFDRNGKHLGDWGGGDQLTRPTGLAFDRQAGLLWVTDTGSHRLLAFDSRGRVVRIVGERGQGPGRFNFPTHLAVGPKGRLFVTDTLNFRVQILSTAGEPLSAFGGIGDGPGSLAKPKGVGVDGDGHFYVVDSLFDNVQIFDEEGRVLLHFGSRGSGPGQFWLPAGLWIADGNRIYVADAYNQRVQVFRYLGE